MEEGIVLLLGFLVLLAFLFALIGVPILWLKTRRLQQDVVRLQQLVTAERPAISANLSRPQVSRPTSIEIEKSIAQNLDELDIQFDEEQPDSARKATEDPAFDPWRDISESVAETGSNSSQPSKSSEPTLVQKMAERFSQVNLTARVGSIVLIFGAIFLGKYASDIGVLTLTAKLSMMAIVSVALIVIGIRYAEKLQQYGEILQATGFAGWLITLFTAHVLFEQISWIPTLVAGAAAVAFIGYRALRQDSQMLAIIAYLGGFLTPFIASSEAASLWRLFSYMGIMNIAVVLTALNKPWRWLVRQAYVSSFLLLAGLMLAEYLQSDLDQWPIQWPMLVFIFSVVISFSWLAGAWLKADGSEFQTHVSGLLFGVPSAAVLALSALLQNQSPLMAGSLVLLAIWYGVLSFVRKTWLFTAIAVVSASLAIPFAVNDALTTIVYSLEGAAFVVWALKHWRLSGLLWGVLVQLAAAIFAFRLFMDMDARQDQLWLSWFLYGAVVLAALISAWNLRAHPQLKQFGFWPERASLLWALIIWLYQWGFWLGQSFSRAETFWYLLWVVTATMVAVFVIARRGWWYRFNEAQPWLGLVFIWSALLYLLDYAMSAQTVQLITVVILALLVWGLLIVQKYFFNPLPSWLALLAWFAIPTVGALALFHAPQLNTDWQLTLALLWPIGIILFLPKLLSHFFVPSPVRRKARMVSQVSVLPLLFATLFALGNYAPLPYWPILHPLSLLVALSAWLFYRAVRHHTRLRAVWVVSCGVALTMELNRWLFHYAGIAYDASTWFDSGLTQTVWTLVWAIIGSVLMVSGARIRLSRTLWLTGSVILAVVVIKLFLLDLAHVDTLYRILSFIGVGGLLLLVGHYAPMPSKVDPLLAESASKGDER